MNKYIKVLPYVLLLTLTPFFFYSQPNLAQSIIVLAVAGLSGYFYYIESKQLPDYRAIFAKELENLHKQNRETREMIVKSQIQEINKKTSSFVF